MIVGLGTLLHASDLGEIFVRLVRHRHAKTGHWAYDLQQKLPADTGTTS